MAHNAVQMIIAVSGAQASMCTTSGSSIVCTYETSRIRSPCHYNAELCNAIKYVIFMQQCNIS